MEVKKLGALLTAGKIRDDCIEEKVFEFNFEEKKGFRQKVVTEQETARLTSQRCLHRI